MVKKIETIRNVHNGSKQSVLRESDNTYYGVFRKGGSIGDNNDDELVKHFGRDSAVLVEIFTDPDEAKEYAKFMRSRLSPGERKYYGVGYLVKPLSRSDMEHPQVKGMISEGKKRHNESLNEDTLYKSVLRKLMPGVATSEIYNQANLGYSFDIDPNYKSIDKVASRLSSQGFTQVDSYESQMYGEDSYKVFINEINGSRVVCCIIYQEDDFAFVTAGYDEEEDQDYFE